MKLINRTIHSTKPMLVVAVLMAIGTLTVGANAQTAWVGKFTLPYEVHLSHAVLPAGQYTITVDSMVGRPAVVRVRSADGNRPIYTGLPIIADGEKGAASLLVTIAGRQHAIRSMNVPLLGVSLIFQPITKTGREELAKAGRLESMPVVTAQK